MVFFLGFVLLVAGAAVALVRPLRDKAQSRSGGRRLLWVVPLLGVLVMIYALLT